MDVLDIMRAAKATERGVEIICSSSELFQRKFHFERNKRRAQGDYFFDSLRCRIVSPTIIFLIHEEPDAERQTETGESNHPNL